MRLMHTNAFNRNKNDAKEETLQNKYLNKQKLSEEEQKGFFVEVKKKQNMMSTSTHLSGYRIKNVKSYEAKPHVWVTQSAHDEDPTQCDLPII